MFASSIIVWRQLNGGPFELSAMPRCVFFWAYIDWLTHHLMLWLRFDKNSSCCILSTIRYNPLCLYSVDAAD